VLCRPRSRWETQAGKVALAWWLDAGEACPEPPAHGRLRIVLQPGSTVPSPWIDGSVVRPVMPFVRERRRRGGDPGTDLASCAAAVVGPDRILEALALATPVVCDAATAAIVGAVDGEHVVVASGPDSQAAAVDALSNEPTRASLLARAGRRLVESRFDMAAAARRVASALDLPPTGMPVIARLASRLEELSTPVEAGVASRAAGAVVRLGPSGAAIAAQSLRW
jgi:hypothetical protein